MKKRSENPAPTVAAPLASGRYWRRDGDTLLLQIHAQPGASRTEVAGLHGQALKVRVSMPPVDGRANQELVAFLAGLTGARRSDVRLVSGESARQKRFAISHASIDDLALERLADARSLR